MSDFRQLYALHRKKRQAECDGGSNGCGGGAVHGGCGNGCSGLNAGGGRRKYKREVIVGADIFTQAEKDFLSLLLVKDEYYIDEVKELVRMEMERVVN